jgi:hypothetical protein
MFPDMDAPPVGVGHAHVSSGVLGDNANIASQLW